MMLDLLDCWQLGHKALLSIRQRLVIYLRKAFHRLATESSVRMAPTLRHVSNTVVLYTMKI